MERGLYSHYLKEAKKRETQDDLAATALKTANA